MKNRVVIVCRTSDEPLKPGNVVGYQCKWCGARLQVSPVGIERLRQYPDAWLACNPCGIKFSTLAKEKDKLAGVELSPNAKEYMESKRSADNPLVNIVKKLREE